MGAIREELVLADSFSGTFNQFNTAADAAIATAEAFKSALDGFSEGFLDGLVSELQKTNQELNDAGNAAHNAAEEQEKVTRETERTTEATGNWVSAIKSAVAALGVAKLTKEFIETADEMTLITAKMDMINDGIYKGSQLQEQVFAAAQSSRSAFADTAQLVTRIGQNASNVFNNAEAIQFAENMNKSFKIAGASQQEIASATLQLSQALASGTLRGEEFNAINESAPSVIQRIADAMDVEKGQMRELAAQGQITADIIKSAMLNATDDINAEFEQIPMTWSDMMTTAKNDIQWALSDIMDQWTEFLNSAEGQQVFEDVTNAIIILAQVGSEALMAVANAIAWVDQNWEAMLPIIDLVIAATLVYAAVQVAAAIRAVVAWMAVNWWLVLIAVALAGFVLYLQSLGVTFQDVGRAAGAVFGAIWAFIQNTAIGFNNLGTDIVTTMADAFDIVLSMIETVAEAIDALFGTGMAGAVAGFRSQVSGWVADTYQRQEYVSYGDTINEWMDKGAGIGAKLDSLDFDLKNIGAGIGNIDSSQFNIADSLGGGGAGEVGKVGKVGSIENDVKLSDEDVKLYRDLAEAKYMQKIELKTLAPKINVSVPHSDNLSADDVAAAIKVVLVEQMNSHTATAHG